MHVLKQQLNISGEPCCPGVATEGGSWGIKPSLCRSLPSLQDAVAKSCDGRSWLPPAMHLSEKDPVYPHHKKNHLFVTMCGNRWELNLLW